jgi:hypothetical protein
MFRKRSWYHKKRFIIPISLLIILLIGASIVGSVSGTRSTTNRAGTTGTVFDILFCSKVSEKSSCKS